MNRLQRAKAHANGAMLEAMIEHGCREYAKKGFARIHKTPEPMKPISRGQGGKYTAIYTKKAQPDFQGTLPGGQSIVFEAKHTDGGQIAQGRVSQTQWEELDAHQILGARCFVLVSFHFERFAMIPWEDWKRMKQMVGRLHLKETDQFVTTYQVKRNGPAILFLDYAWLPIGGTSEEVKNYGERIQRGI